MKMPDIDKMGKEELANLKHDYENLVIICKLKQLSNDYFEDGALLSSKACETAIRTINWQLPIDMRFERDLR